MHLLIALLGLLIAAIGVVGLLAPTRLLRLVDLFWRGERSLYVASGMRIVLGSLMILAAPYCAWPTVVTVLGVLTFVAGVLLVVIGFERVNKLIQWWQRRPPGVVRVSALFAVCFGVLLFWAAG